jgi:hypothetical protein
MERYCSTGQSPQRAVAPTEEEEEDDDDIKGRPWTEIWSKRTTYSSGYEYIVRLLKSVAVIGK